jgi:hypothetical protein
VALEVDRGRHLGSCEARLTTEDPSERLGSTGKRSPDRRRFTNALWFTIALPFAVVGALISVRRPGNRIGVLMLWGTVAFAGFQAALSYVMYGLPQGLPGLVFAGWIANWIWVPAAIGFLLVAYWNLFVQTWGTESYIAAIAGPFIASGVATFSFPVFESKTWESGMRSS